MVMRMLMCVEWPNIMIIPQGMHGNVHGWLFQVPLSPWVYEA
jgi:hypothetical protein